MAGKECIWYISKYVAPPGRSSVGGRGYLLMREFARVGYESVIITSDSNALAEVPRLTQPYLFQRADGVRICWVRTVKYRVAKSLRRILSWLDFEWRLLLLPKSQLPSPSIVIVSSLSLLTILNGFLLRRRFNCRLVMEIRDIWPLTITEEGGFSKYNPLVLGLGLIEKLGYRYADEIVGTMPNLGEHVAEVLGYERPVECIPMGIDETGLLDGEPMSPEYEEKYIPRDKFLIVHAGTIGITNALETFLECARAMEVFDGIHFLIVGDGDLRTSYQSRFGKLRNLTFAPRVPKQMVQAVLRKCDVLYFSVHVSAVWEYGQSLNKVIDYMLAGKPILASFTGYPSMINEAHCGSYVPAGDVEALQKEVERYVAMPSVERDEIGHRGREWIIANRRYGTLARNYLEIMFPGLRKGPKSAPRDSRQKEFT